MSDKPLTTGDNGHRPDGRFAKGNKLAKGNPFAAKVAKLRAALLDSVSPDDLKRVVKTLLEQAEGGDVAAIRELLTRTLGPAESLDVLQRLEVLEQTFKEKQP